MRENKFSITEVEKAVEYFKKKVQAAEVLMKFDDMGRLIMEATDPSGQRVTIRLFDMEAKMFPEITKTERF